jgi:hypothetical protein
MALNGAADLQAGVAARNDKAGHTADVANLDVFRRRGLPCRKIGSLGAGDSHNTGRRSEQHKFKSMHEIPPKAVLIFDD